MMQRENVRARINGDNSAMAIPGGGEFLGTGIRYINR